MKIFRYTLYFILSGFMLASCEDYIHDPEKEFANDVTFNVAENSLDIEVPELDFIQLDAPFTARAYRYGTITMNAKKNADGTHSGFALSNKNYRSYPWSVSLPHGDHIENIVQSQEVESCAVLLAAWDLSGLGEVDVMV